MKKISDNKKEVKLCTLTLHQFKFTIILNILKYWYKYL